MVIIYDTNMQTVVSKSQFKPQALEYLRLVEKTKKPLVITHAGKKVIKVVPYSDKPENSLKALQGSVIVYKQPSTPVGQKDWEALK